MQRDGKEEAGTEELKNRRNKQAGSGRQAGQEGTEMDSRDKRY